MGKLDFAVIRLGLVFVEIYILVCGTAVLQDSVLLNFDVANTAIF